MKYEAGKRSLSVLLLLALTLCTSYHLFLWPGPGCPAVARPERFSQSAVVIDAGHGGEDGGAVSPSGNIESIVNLAVAKRLDAILGLFGTDVVMLRTEDATLDTSHASTVRERKTSDLHNRVDRVQAVPNATLISIHQNKFDGGSRYHGAQVFFASTEQSRELAQFTQEILRLSLDPENGRKATKIPDRVYLMSHITCRAILVECGFLSNPEEDALLQTGGYQTKIAAALAGAYLGYTENPLEGEVTNES